MLCAAARYGWALDPYRSLTQYSRTVWTQADGLPQDTVRAITQTADGYLWLGTEEGLARFDGYEFTTFDKRDGDLPSNYITALAATADVYADRTSMRQPWNGRPRPSWRPPRITRPPWLARPAPSVEASPRVAGRTVPDAQSRVFGKDGLLLYVWFWHLVGGRSQEYENPYSVFRLFDLALKYGFQPGREQLFVRISSNRSWAEISTGPVVEKFFENLRPLGL